MGKQTQRGQLVWPTSHDKLEAGPVSLPEGGPAIYTALGQGWHPISQAQSGLGSISRQQPKKKLKEKKNFVYTADKCNTDTVTSHAVIPYLLEAQDSLAKAHCGWDPDQYIDTV